MFTKLYHKVKIYSNVTRAASRWITYKQVISNSNRHLPYDFNTIQLNMPKDLNKSRGWSNV